MDVPHSDLEVIRQILADLTHRVSRIERKLGIEGHSLPEPPSPGIVAPSAPAPPAQRPDIPPRIASDRPLRPPPPYPLPPPLSVQRQADPELEARIGSHWLNRIGIAALLIGISYFLKFAFENNWIGPAGRVSIGLLAGLLIVAWSERFRSRGYQAFSYSLKAVGIGALYLSLWAAFQVYQLTPGSVAFMTMLTVTAATAAMALAQDAQILASFALIGGFITPVLLSTGANREVALFTYVTILDVATLILVIFKPWRRLLVMSYLGTLLLYIGWYSSFYTLNQLGITLGFATLFFAIFAVAPLVALQPETEAGFFTSVPAVLAFANAIVYFLLAYAMVVEVNKTLMAWFALALAVVNIFLSVQRSRKLSADSSRILHWVHVALAIGFITVAIPIRLDAHWITIGWFVEAGVLLWVANRAQSDFFNAFALGALFLGVVRLLMVDNFQSTQLIFNARMGTYGVAVVVLGAVAWSAGKREDEAAHSVSAVAIVALNLLGLVAFSHEVADYYARQYVAFQPPRVFRGPAVRHYYNDEIRQLDIQRDFAYSALWMAYGAVLMVIGFLRRSAFVRWQALVLIAATIAKVFIHDVFELNRGYRIVSFIVLGVLLLAISFVYQRDWLQLSGQAPERRGRP